MFEGLKATDSAAREVLRVLDEGGYVGAGVSWVAIGDLQAAAERGTRSYTPDELKELRERAQAGSSKPRVEVIEATTSQAALMLSNEAPLALLNFASARNPGGGFLRGPRAQEEELCRCSGLHRTLVSQPDYYRANREESSALYTDHLIYSPVVPFFRVSSHDPWLDQPFTASVITTPAPNARAIRENKPSDSLAIESTFLRRWMNVLAVAQDQGLRVVVLGARGCGAFGNDPLVAASTAAAAIESPRFGGAFECIVFAIPSFGTQSRWNLLAFRRQFEEP